MRIALITTSFLPHVGGAEFAAHHLARHWCRQGHDVCVMNAVADRPSEPGAPYTVRRFRMLRGMSRFGAHRAPFMWFGSRELRRIIETFEPDAISAHFAYPTAMWLAHIRPVPRFLITDHGPALNVTPRGPRQRHGITQEITAALNGACGVVALSSHARQVMEAMGVAAAKIVDIPNGVEAERFARRVEHFDLRRTLNLPPSATVILSVGRDSWAKAYDDGLRAFAEVARQTPHAHYVIVGRGTARWRPLAQELGVAGRVVFREGFFGDELVGTYQQADVFFLPSVKELCPLVVLEAMAAGRPQVVTNVSGSQDMIDHDVNGLMVEPRDTAAMSSALVRLLNDRSRREAMGQSGLAKAPRYDWCRVSREYLRHM